MHSQDSVCVPWNLFYFQKIYSPVPYFGDSAKEYCLMCLSESTITVRSGQNLLTEKATVRDSPNFT